MVSLVRPDSPHLEGLISTRRDQPLSIRTESDGIHALRVTEQRTFDRSFNEVPDSDCSIFAR